LTNLYFGNYLDQGICVDDLDLDTCYIGENIDQLFLNRRSLIVSDI